MPIVCCLAARCNPLLSSASGFKFVPFELLGPIISTTLCFSTCFQALRCGQLLCAYGHFGFAFGVLIREVVANLIRLIRIFSALRRSYTRYVNNRTLTEDSHTGDVDICWEIPNMREALSCHECALSRWNTRTVIAIHAIAQTRNSISRRRTREQGRIKWTQRLQLQLRRLLRLQLL